MRLTIVTVVTILIFNVVTRFHTAPLPIIRSKSKNISDFSIKHIPASLGHDLASPYRLRRANRGDDNNARQQISATDIGPNRKRGKRDRVVHANIRPPPKSLQSVRVCTREYDFTNFDDAAGTHALAAVYADVETFFNDDDDGVHVI